MNRAKIDDLIIYLMAIKGYAKDIHYNCAGDDFWGKHKFADRFTDKMDEYIDLLKEVCLLGHRIVPFDNNEYYELASKTTPKKVYDFKIMRGLMLNCLEHIETIKDVSKGDENVIGAIAQDIQNNVGLLNIMFGEAENGLC